MMEPTLISYSAFAKRMRVSQQAVSKSVRNGRLKASVRRDDRGRPRLDAEAAAVEWTANTQRVPPPTTRSTAGTDAAGAGPATVPTAEEFLAVVCVSDRLIALAVCDDVDNDDPEHIVSSITLTNEAAIVIGRWLASVARKRRDGEE